MKVNGSILLDRQGSFSKINQYNINTSILNFAYMVKEADDCKDTLYYDSEEWMQFHAKSYCRRDPYWNGVGDIEFSMLFNVSNPVFKPVQIGSREDFNSKSMPRTLGGFLFEGCSEENYVYNKHSIIQWHSQWLRDNPDKIDWSKSVNGIFPCYDKTIAILRNELQKLKDNPYCIKGLEYVDRKLLASIDLESLDSKEIVSKFYSLIMDHKDESGEKVSYAKEIGSQICESNYYHHEKELELLNNANDSIVKIYSIKKGDEYQFLSIDIKHGRFEWCNEKGDHISEVMFDGESVANSKDVNHSILNVEKWKRIYDK